MISSATYLKTLSWFLSVGMMMSASAIATASSKSTLVSQCQQMLAANIWAEPSFCLSFKARRMGEYVRRNGGVPHAGYWCYEETGERIQPIAILPEIPSGHREKLRGQELLEILPTVNSHPVFFVYVPPTKAENAEFALLSENGEQLIYEETVTLPDNGGIVSVSIPENVQLEVNQPYRWILSLQCDFAEVPGWPYVEGLVKVIQEDNNLTQELKQATELERPAIYAKHGIWTDTLSSLAKLRKRYPNNQLLIADWQCLLESVGLAEIAKEPLIGS